MCLRNIMSKITEIPFSKYHGCGNDFIMINDTQNQLGKIFENPSTIKRLSDRNIGIGGDGVIQLRKHGSYDFVMEYYTGKHGTPAMLCGNGSRCSVMFAKDIGLITLNCN